MHSVIISIGLFLNDPLCLRLSMPRDGQAQSAMAE